MPFHIIISKLSPSVFGVHRILSSDIIRPPIFNMSKVKHVIRSKGQPSHQVKGTLCHGVKGGDVAVVF